MMNPNDYTDIFFHPKRTFMFKKEGGSYSFLQEDVSPDDPKVKSYTEIIVPVKALDDALETIPSSEDDETAVKLHLLFGNYDGFDHFRDFCDEYDIETRTLIWD